MGWTSMYTDKNRTDTVREILRGVEIVDLSFVGSVCYLACKEPEKKDVFAVIILTDSRRYNGCNFSYKVMDETVIPCYYDCPTKILKLLTPTDNIYSLEWRKKVLEAKEDKKRQRKWEKSIPLGGKIITEYGGRETILIKSPPRFQFKKWFWYEPSSNTYRKKKYVTYKNSKAV